MLASVLIVTLLGTTPLLTSAHLSHDTQSPPVPAVLNPRSPRGSFLSPKSRPDSDSDSDSSPAPQAIDLDFDRADSTDAAPGGMMYLDSNGDLTYISSPTQAVNPSDPIRLNTVITDAAVSTPIDPTAPIQVKTQKFSDPSNSASGVSSGPSSETPAPTSSAVNEPQVVDGGAAASSTLAISTSSTNTAALASASSVVGGGSPFTGSAARAVVGNGIIGPAGLGIVVGVTLGVVAALVL